MVRHISVCRARRPSTTRDLVACGVAGRLQSELYVTLTAMGDWVAIGASTDRRGHARALARAHSAMASRGPVDPAEGPDPSLRAVISRSWQRSQAAGVDPSIGTAPTRMSQEDASRRWSEHPLATAEPIVRRLLEDLGEEAGLAVICDPDGTLLWIDGAPAAVARALEDGMCPGSGWTEREVGTNGVGTVLAERRPVQIFSAEHFAAPIHSWVCSAAPILDPLTGKLAGVLDITGDFTTAHPHSLAVVGLAARAIEHQMLVDAQVQARRILRLPEASLSVLGRDRGLLRVGHRETELSRRHTELLLLLWLRPEGLSAEQLALEAYGERGRPGSVRTEMHRLRAHLGSMLGERPYRLLGAIDCDVTAVEAHVREGDMVSAMRLYRGSPLRQTEVPRLTELRDRLDDAMRAGVLSAGDPSLLEAWLHTPAGRDDYEVSRRLIAMLGRDDPRRAAERSRLRRLREAFSEDPAPLEDPRA